MKFAALFLSLLCVLHFVSCSPADGGTPEGGSGTDGQFVMSDPVPEMRGIYIATVYNLDFPSKRGLDAAVLRKELDEIVSLTEGLGCNAVYFQVRGAADAMYDSDIFPVSEYLTGVSGGELPEGFDPLGYLIERAHEHGIGVHAWVNPLRVTRGGGPDKPKTAEDLPESSPARMSPELTVTYAGNIYFDAGIPEARELIADGVREIVKKYDVDGVLFDDYFYPSPVDGEVYDDAAIYGKYGEGADIGDWRRENINKMVKACYEAVKKADAECRFGIAPCGIWQNDDGENGGSRTRGFESYETIYCDTLAWVEGGYVDYVAPQIYWSFSNESASYAVLADWWCAQLDGTGVDLYISHAAYKYGTEEWRFAGAVDEMKEQLTYARELISYRGSIMYGFSEIRDDVNGLAGELADCYSEDVSYSVSLPTGEKFSFEYPASGSVTKEKTVMIRGKSAPETPLLCDGRKVCRLKDGTFRHTVTLRAGKNRFVFNTGGGEYEYVISYIA